MIQRWSAIFCATGVWGNKPIGRLRVKPLKDDFVKQNVFLDIKITYYWNLLGFPMFLEWLVYVNGLKVEIWWLWEVLCLFYRVQALWQNWLEYDALFRSLWFSHFLFDRWLLEIFVQLESSEQVTDADFANMANDSW